MAGMGFAGLLGAAAPAGPPQQWIAMQTAAGSRQGIGREVLLPICWAAQQRAAGYGCAGLSGIAAESFGYKLHIELHTGVKGIGRSGTSDRDGRPQTLS
jgi:hypothetical protein